MSLHLNIFFHLKKIESVCHHSSSKKPGVYVEDPLRALTSEEASDLPDPPLKADHKGAGDSQLHEGPPVLQTGGGPA